MKVPDVNLLIYAVDRRSPLHKTAVHWWNGLLSGTETVAFSWNVLLAFIRLTTNPRVVQSPLSPDEALDYVDRWLAQSVATVIEPTRRHASVLRDLLGGVGTAGNLVSDAHLAALAIEHGAELCSADRDFGRFPGAALGESRRLGPEVELSGSSRSGSSRPSVHSSPRPAVRPSAPPTRSSSRICLARHGR